MKRSFLFFIPLFFTLLSFHPGYSQGSWALCNAPAFGNRVDDIFMATAQVGYAVYWRLWTNRAGKRGKSSMRIKSRETGSTGSAAQDWRAGHLLPGVKDS